MKITTWEKNCSRKKTLAIKELDETWLTHKKKIRQEEIHNTRQCSPVRLAGLASQKLTRKKKQQKKRSLKAQLALVSTFISFSHSQFQGRMDQLPNIQKSIKITEQQMH